MEKVGIDPLPRHIASDYLSSEELTQEYPLILITGARDRYHYLTKHRELTWARKVAPFPKLQMSPELGESLNIADGDWVHIETPWGTKRCSMKAAYDEKMHPKVVHAPFGWYYPEKEDLGAFESSINAILPNDAPYDPVVGIPTLKPLVCRVKKAEDMEDWDFVEGLTKAFQ
jgi:anaerobic selenocysteine-containing dehydrogenase